MNGLSMVMICCPLSASAKENRRQSHQNQLHVAPQGLGPDVPPVHTNPFSEADAGTPLDLPDARQARRNIEPAAVPRRAPIALFDGERSRSDKRHIPAQNIE